jgi:ribose/xylose/arabinose/galactoside ABC-type transport system permease subunit
MDIAADAAPVAMIACAVMLVVVTGEIDISVGSLLGLSAATMGMLCYGPDPVMSIPGAILCALLVAVGVGAINGFLVTFGRVPSIIATLAMLTMLRGIMKLSMQGTSIYGRPDALRELAIGQWFGLPNSVCLAIAVSAGIAFVAHRTPIGRRIYAVGSNPRAARLLGISVRKTKFLVFVLSGLLTGVAAVMLAPRNSLIQPNMGSGLELLVITCVVVGGASIRGGRGTIRGTLLAVLLLSLVPTALIYVGAPSEWRMAVQGVFILAAVVVDTLVLQHVHATSG